MTHTTVVGPEEPAFSQEEIERMLGELRIEFESVGHVGGKLRYSSLRNPRPQGLYYLARGAGLPDGTGGSLALVGPGGMVGPTCACIRVAHPQRVFYKLMRATSATRAAGGIHPSAIIAAGVTVPDDAVIGPYCILESGVEIGSGCVLDSHVVVKSRSIIGAGTRIEPHCTIGATGVAWVWDDDGEHRVIQPQIGGVRIGCEVFIGSDVSIVRGSVSEWTDIGDYSVIAHGTKIGHGCRVGRHVHMANNVSLGGNVDVGDKAFLGSGAVVRPQARIAQDVIVAAGAVVASDIAEAGVVVAGVPAKKIQSIGDKLSGVPERASKKGQP
jgi:UDP-3-O-[3-hydroxymyristoyl] glucosamine N-acyltransferase